MAVELAFLLVPVPISRRFGEFAHPIQQNPQYNPHLAVVPTLIDLAEKLKGMYRLLDLIEESGSNGYGEWRSSHADSLANRTFDS